MNKQVLLMTLAVLMSFGVGGCQTTSEQSASSSGDQPGLRSAGTQEQRANEERLRQQNLEERKRLESSSTREHSSTEMPMYSENQPIGGQKQAGAADFPQPAFPFVKGELVQIEGEYYILRDAEGKNVRVHVDKRTQMEQNLRIGDTVDVQRTLPGHALSMRRSSEPLAPSASSASAGVGAGDPLVKDSQVTLGGAKQVVRGEVLQIDGDKYLIRDGHGNEVRLAVNQNTRMSCSADKGSVSALLPAPSASDRPDASGQPQDLSRTAEQQGSDVGPGTRRAGNETRAMGQCFNKGELIEAEISDMGVATFVKIAGRRQPGQALP